MVCCLVKEPASAGSASGVLEIVARACSPRVAPHGDDAVIFDAEGLGGVLGPPDAIAREVQQMTAREGIVARVVVADTMTAAWVLAHARAGVTVVPAGRVRDVLAPIPVSWLASVFELDRAVGASTGRRPVEERRPAERETPTRSRRPRPKHFRAAPPPSQNVGNEVVADRQIAAACRDRLATLARWGIRTCGDLASLARADIHARMGPVGVRLHQAAGGEDVAPLVPVDPDRVFANRMELDWPIEGLEPLAFVLARQCEQLSSALERADRGAVALHTTLTLVTRETHVRDLTLPAPLRDARVLRTLILLDLESHPPPAAIDAVEVRVDVTPGRILQGSLLRLSIPTPEDLSTLVARLGALIGVTRVGAPVPLDTHDARQVALKPFVVPDMMPLKRSRPNREFPNPEPAPGTQNPAPRTPVSTLRRFRLPIATRVVTDHGTPTRVMTGIRDLPGGPVVTCAGPWRSSGAWWTNGRTAWDRDEWDVEFSDGGVYRLARVRSSGAWEIEGVFD